VPVGGISRRGHEAGSRTSSAFATTLSLQIGGALWTGAGDPSANTHFPADLQVDYVRVYQHG
jgi:hypothetical protein